MLQYYQDPEAREKLKHLASPKNFDEALIYGFPTSPPQVVFGPEESLQTSPSTAYWPSPKVTAGAIPRASNDAHRFLRQSTLSWLDNDDDDEHEEELDSEDDDGDDLYDDQHGISRGGEDELYRSPTEPDSPITPREHDFTGSDHVVFSPTDTIASLYAAEDVSSERNDAMSFPTPPSRTNTTTSRSFKTTRDTKSSSPIVYDDDAGHFAFQSFHGSSSTSSTVPPSPPPKDTPRNLSFVVPDLPIEQHPAERVLQQPQISHPTTSNHIALPDPNDSSYSGESSSRRTKSTRPNRLPPWPAPSTREMTMRMTLTRPELRAPEEQIYGNSFRKESVSAPVSPFHSSSSSGLPKSEPRKKRAAAREPQSLQELPEAWEADAGCWAGVGVGRATRMSVSTSGGDGGGPNEGKRESKGEGHRVKGVDGNNAEAKGEVGRKKTVWKKMSLSGLRR